MAPSQRTLVIGIDYSDFCIPALDRGLRMAAQSPGSRLAPILALPYATTPSVGAEAAIDEFLERARENLARLVQVRSRVVGVTGVEVAPEVCLGEPAACLLQRAQELDADLIVVGTHGRKGLQHLLMGSVAEEVVRRASCSVLVARARPVAASEQPRATEQAGRTGSELDISREQADAAQLVEGEAAQPLGDPHIEADSVILHVLDVPSGYVFVCSFVDFGSVRVEPLEGAWAPQPTPEARVRAARAALAEARRDAPRFEELFEELARRAHARASASSEPR